LAILAFRPHHRLCRDWGKWPSERIGDNPFTRNWNGFDAGFSCLTNVAAERGADLLEGLIESPTQSLHSGSGPESNECNDQSIFNQILTFFAGREVLELYIDPEKRIVHRQSPSWSRFSPRTADPKQQNILSGIKIESPYGGM
jgi:hypothetical protein